MVQPLNIRELLMDIKDLLLGGGNSAVTLTATTASVAAGATLDTDIALTTTSKLSIHRIKVVASASDDFDVLFYPTDGYVANYEDYENINNNLKFNELLPAKLNYEDEDASNELHMRIINTDGVHASTFTYFIYCTKV